MRAFDLDNNQLTTFLPDIGCLFHLYYLSLNDNQLTSLPSEIEHSHTRLYFELLGNPLKISDGRYLSYNNYF
ncbi:hypothetical protein DB42_AQ00150 [Neochlamydia sp. EPS4]|uniref:hypothetical protein n=1 Tax=Neochlamydia sp. EPS4 TaxID=1478175 RepID=UPI0005836274|nr:hypothetical protein [Neochlamydia sp. EPS4]KIC75035.1 hypothetical protein DB42_AQ00150 [Neochlamydia sp. EPS4]